MWRALGAFVIAAGLFATSLVAQQTDRLGRAVQFNDQGQHTEARELLDTIVREEPHNHRALWNRGLVAMQDEEYDVALDWFERALAIDGDDAEYHVWRGYAYVQKLERSNWLRKLVIAPKIRKSFERAVELAPTHLEARRALMLYYEQAPGLLGGGKAKAREQQEAIRRLESGSNPAP
jgi:tetratricopeptide (TPR) repeat protein